MTRAFLFIFGSLVAPVALFSKRQPPNACRFFLLTPGLHPTHPTFSPCVSGPQVSCSFDTAMYFRTAKHSTTSVAVTAIAQRPSGTPLNAIPSTARRSLKCQAGSNDGRRMGTSSEGEECLSTPGRQLGRRTTLSALLGTASFAAAAAAGALEGDQELETSPPGAAASRVYFDVAIDTVPAGRVVVECADTVAGQRLAALARGEKKGGVFISYLRRVEVIDVTDGTVSTGPLRELKNLNGSDVEDLPGGEGADGLRDAVKSEKAERRAEGSGGVWLRAFDDVPPLAPSKKLVSRNGKLELETELGPPPPNGTSVTLCGSSSCGALLAETHAYAGRVVSGGDLVEEIAALPTVRVNRKLKYGSNVADIIAPRENRTFKKVTMKAGLL